MSFIKEFEGRKVEVKALDCKVLAIAIEWTNLKAWTAYINAVLGKDHEAEWEEAMHHGSRLDESVAKAIFPDWKAEYIE